MVITKLENSNGITFDYDNSLQTLQQLMQQFSSLCNSGCTNCDSDGKCTNCYGNRIADVNGECICGVGYYEY